LANLSPGLPDRINRQHPSEKKFFWDTMKNSHRHWLAANMEGEAFLGFGAFNT
jgi:6-oxocyclohex-1-ene-carbonyl-CoA hydrolase